MLILHVVDEKIKNPELRERFEQKKEEMEEEIEEQRQKVQEIKSQKEKQQAVDELKKTVYLKTYSWLSDHDGVKEIVQVE